MSTRTPRELTAHHEAAHAVACIRFDGCPASATILSGAGNAGQMSGDSIDLEGLLILDYAGLAAELELGCEAATARASAILDIEHACLYFPSHDEASEIERSRAFVRSNWSAIELIAAELVQRETLDSDELFILVEIADGKATPADLAAFRAGRQAREDSARN